MLNMSSHFISRLIRTTGICAMMIAIVALAFGSKGGGSDKKNSASFKSDFTPIRTTSGFTLKTWVPCYSGSHIFTQERTANTISFNTVVTYQKGNTIYIFALQIQR